MAWIQVEQSLFTHRKTVRLASLLHVDHEAAAMRMIRLWTWALDNAPEGDLSDLTPDVIAFGASWQGDAESFVDALEQAGFTDRDGATLTLHHWWQYAGKLIEKRRANAARMREARGTHNTATSGEPERTYKERATHVQRTTDARAGATGEKSREESSTNSKREIDEIGGGGNTNRAREGPAEPAAAILDRLGITENGTSGTAAAAQQIREALNRIPEEDRLLLAGECRNRYDDWDAYSPGKKAGLVTKWVREEAKGPPSERGARASPNGASDLPWLADDPAEDAHYRKWDEELKVKAKQRANSSS